MAKRYGRPSAQYRYEHYDPTPWETPYKLDAGAG